MTGKSSSAGRRDSGGAGWLLGLIFVCLAAGIVAAGYLYYRNYEKRYRSEVERQLSAVADLKVGELVQWRKERLGDAGTLFKNAAFTALVRLFFAQPEDVDARRQLQGWIGRIQTSYQYDRVFLLDARGIERLAAPDSTEPVPAHLADDAAKVLHSGQVTFLDFHRDAPDRPIHLGILVSIYDESDAGYPLGVLVLHIDPATYLYPLLQRWPTPSLTAETLLVRREGNEVVFLNELRFQKNTALTLRAPLDQMALPAARAASGQEGVMEGIDYRGAPVVAALRTIPGSPWFLVARMDAAEVYAPLRERLWQMVVLIGAVLFGAGASIALVWRHQRVRFYRTKYESEEARARLAAIVECSDDAIIGKSLDGTITSWNASAERLFGYRAAEMIGQSVTRIIPPNTHAQEAEILKRLRRGERVEHYEGVRLAKDGRPVAVSLTISPVRDATGTIIGAAKIARDITERKRVEEALRASEEGFRIAAETANDLVYEWDLKQSVQWPGKIDRMLGYEPGEFPRTLDGWAASVHPEDLKRVMAAVQAHLEGHAVYEEEYRVRTKDGIYRWWSARGAAARTPEGKPVRWIGSITDITERKRVEEALRESQAFYSSLVAQLPAGVFRKDREGRYVFVSPWFCRLKGIEKEGFLGKTPQEVAASEAAKQDPLGRAIKYAGEGEDQHALIMQTGDPVELVEEYTDAAGRKQFVHAIKIPVINSEGKVIGSEGLLFDITAHKQAEDALRENEKRLQFALDVIETGEWDLDLINHSANRSLKHDQIFGYETLLPQWTYEMFLEHVVPEDRAVVDQKFRQAIESKSDWHFECRIDRRDGEQRWILASGRHRFDPSGQPHRMVGIVQDITERKRAQEALRTLNVELEQRVRDRTAELEAANQELEAFSYSVSHDLRAPLRAMDGFSMALLEDCAGKLDEAAQDHLRRIRAGSQRMGVLIDDLLNLSREARTEMRRENVDLTAMAEEINAEFQRAHPDRQVKSVVAPALTADADARMLRMVLHNLLDNAWKFTGRCAQARIEVGAREQDGPRVFFVRDNGAGFDMAYAGRLFGAFQRLHSTQEFAGTGIGLAIVQRIIHRHGGRVWAEGAVGQGATVYFTLKGK